MSDSLNVNILVAAKDEYTKQFINLLCPEIYDIINDIYKESQKVKKLMPISLKNFQIFLKKIPEWNKIKVENNINNIKTKIPFLIDLITAIFVTNIKILSSVRLNKDTKNISIKIPDINIFLHKIIITIGEKFFYNPNIILEKKSIVYNFISDKIENSIRTQIPIDTLLIKYLSGYFNELNQENENIKNESDNECDNESCNESDDESDNESHNESHNESNKTIDTTRPLFDIQTKPIEKPMEKQKNKILFNDAKDYTLVESDSESLENDVLENDVKEKEN